MGVNDNTWEEFYDKHGEDAMMLYPFGCVIEFIKIYLSKYCLGGGIVI